MNYLTYSQVYSTLNNKLNILKEQNSGFLPRLASCVYTTQSAETAEKIENLIRALPMDDSPVQGAILRDVSHYLEIYDIQCLNYSQIRTLSDSIDDSYFSFDQKTLLKKLKNLQDSDGERILTEFYDFVKKGLFKEPAVFETFLRNVPDEIFPSLTEIVKPVLRDYIKQFGFTDISDNDYPEILDEIRKNQGLINSLKYHLPDDTILQINETESIKVNKQALSISSSWFKEAFQPHTFKNIEVQIIENDIKAFRILIDYLMGENVEVPEGHDFSKRMYGIASKYRINELMTFYDYKLTRCFNCFSKEERARIIKDYPLLKIFKKAVESNNAS